MKEGNGLLAELCDSKGEQFRMGVILF